YWEPRYLPRSHAHIPILPPCEVLSGPQKHGIYDPHGEEGLSHEGGQHAPLRHVSSFGGGRRESDSLLIYRSAHSI
ncbi:hypothetical protein JB92DRAFT_2888976, partial [Gautieria morchelliformis]